jgi:hypothetical protein
VITWPPILVTNYSFERLRCRLLSLGTDMRKILLVKRRFDAALRANSARKNAAKGKAAMSRPRTIM